MDKREYIARLAAFLNEHHTTMSVIELADHLNRNQFKTSYGTDYEGGRGSYRLISTTYDWLVAAGRQEEANYVAAAFPKSDGDYAYK